MQWKQQKVYNFIVEVEIDEFYYRVTTRYLK